MRGSSGSSCSGDSPCSSTTNGANGSTVSGSRDHHPRSGFARLPRLGLAVVLAMTFGGGWQLAVLLGQESEGVAAARVRVQELEHKVAALMVQQHGAEEQLHHALIQLRDAEQQLLQLRQRPGLRSPPQQPEPDDQQQRLQVESGVGRVDSDLQQQAAAQQQGETQVNPPVPEFPATGMVLQDQQAATDQQPHEEQAAQPRHHKQVVLKVPPPDAPPQGDIGGVPVLPGLPLQLSGLVAGGSDDVWGKEAVDLVIGIPTAARAKKSFYLADTLRGLFRGATPEEMERCKVVVMIMGVNDESQQTLATLQREFACEIGDGLLVLRMLDTSAYPLDGLKHTYGDSDDRVRWRSKQNLDYAALMEFAAPMGKRYLQLEDDVHVARGYLSRIFQAIAAMDSAGVGPAPAMVSFCSMGFIGKLMRGGGVLLSLSRMLRAFYVEMPCDWLVAHWQGLIESTTGKPTRASAAPYHRPDLFQHVGRDSTLAAKKDNRIASKSYRPVAWTAAELSPGGGGGGAAACYVCGAPEADRSDECLRPQDRHT